MRNTTRLPQTQPEEQHKLREKQNPLRGERNSAPAPNTSGEVVAWRKEPSPTPPPLAVFGAWEGRSGPVVAGRRQWLVGSSAEGSMAQRGSTQAALGQTMEAERLQEAEDALERHQELIAGKKQTRKEYKGGMWGISGMKQALLDLLGCLIRL